VIALFYSSGIAVSGLLIAAFGVALILALRVVAVRAFSAYILPAVVVWVGVHSSGIHPTIAGVIVGLLTPVQAWLDPKALGKARRDPAPRITGEASHSRASSREILESMHGVGSAHREAESPADVLIEALHPWVAFLIMPVFALANAGVNLHELASVGATATVSVAIAAALVLGKPLGIIAVSLLAIWSGLSALPEGLNIRHLAVLGMVAGIGFTMSLFIAQLAFADASLLGAAKLGVLAASGVASILGLAIGRAVLPLAKGEQAPQLGGQDPHTESP
jgi:NhaA family Na+:H+ antiporter